jgi:hypothetical protein
MLLNRTSIPGLTYLSNAEKKSFSKHRGDQAIPCMGQGKKCHRLAKYSLVVREDPIGCKRVNETCLRHRTVVASQSAVPSMSRPLHTA